MDPILPGVVPCTGALLDERGRLDFRDLFGALAGGARAIATALTGVRLSGVDLTQLELDGLRSFRVLVAELSAIQLDREARAIASDPGRAPRVALLQRLLESGVLEVRSAPLGGWSPDFTVFADDAGPCALLTGYHWFERPFPHRGPALASLHHGDPARLAATRHRELWDRAHDVGPAIWDILSRSKRSVRVGTGT